MPKNHNNDKDRTRINEQPDNVAPPVSDSTLRAVKELMGEDTVKRVKKTMGEIPRKGWGSKGRGV